MRAKGHIGIYPYSSVVVAAVLETLPAIDGLSAKKPTARPRVAKHAD